MLEKSVVEWTSCILALSRKGLKDGALSLFLQMMRQGVQPNETTLSVTIGASNQFPSAIFGASLHCLAFKKGFGNQLFVCSGLISMYSKYGLTMEARRVFDGMIVRDAASWNSMISGYVQNGFDEEVYTLFYSMVRALQNWKLYVDNFTFPTVLKACAALGCVKIGKSVHGCAIRLCFHSDIYVGGAIVDMYSKCGDVNIAYCVFDRLEDRDLAVWNSMIAGYTQNFFEDEVIELFIQLLATGFLPNETTLCCALTASISMSSSNLGRCLHSGALKSGFSYDIFVGTAIVDMYAKFIHINDAEKAFTGLMEKNLVTFNALITGYGLIGEYEKGLRAYMQLQSIDYKPDAFTFTALFSACSVVGTLAGVQLHSHSIRFGLNSYVLVGNSIMNFYSKCGLPELALKAFESLIVTNALSWAGIISCFAQNGDTAKALEHFCKLRKLSKDADVFSYSSTLHAIISHGSLDLGKQMHAHVLQSGIQDSPIVGSALIDMYSKFGLPQHAHNLFVEIPESNVVCWNSLITGYAHNGLFKEVLLLFKEMKDSGMVPTAVTFLAVLVACSHSGLIEEGKKHYDSMLHKYMIPPSKEHCTCMVNLLGRTGYLHEAEAFILSCPFLQESVIWSSLLAVCCLHGNSDIGARAAERSASLQPNDSTIYATLSNIYASKELWGDVTTVRNFMEEAGIRKKTGFSWIEVKDHLVKMQARPFY